MVFLAFFPKKKQGKDEQGRAPSVAIFLRLRWVAGEKIAAIFWAPKGVLPRQQSLATFPCDRKSQVIAILFAIFRGKERPHCGLAGDRDVCNKKSRRFAIAIFWCSQVVTLAGRSTKRPKKP